MIILLSLLGSIQGTHQVIALISIIQLLATAPDLALTLNNSKSFLNRFEI